MSPSKLRYWDPMFGDRRVLQMCRHCTNDCKVSIPAHQREGDLCGSVQCVRTGFNYTPGQTSSPEKKLDSLGAFAL